MTTVFRAGNKKMAMKRKRTAIEVGGFESRVNLLRGLRDSAYRSVRRLSNNPASARVVALDIILAEVTVVVVVTGAPPCIVVSLYGEEVASLVTWQEIEDSDECAALTACRSFFLREFRAEKEEMDASIGR